MVIHKASTVGKINGMIEGNCFSQCVLSCGCLWPQPNHALHLGSAYQLKKRKRKKKNKTQFPIFYEVAAKQFGTSSTCVVYFPCLPTLNKIEPAYIDSLRGEYRELFQRCILGSSLPTLAPIPSLFCSSLLTINGDISDLLFSSFSPPSKKRGSRAWWINDQNVNNTNCWHKSTPCTIEFSCRD